MLIIVVLLWQVTIVTNNVPAVGGESGETRCQGDMEKADMVDGRKPVLIVCSSLHFIRSARFWLFVAAFWQESKRVCAGRPLQRSTPTKPVSTRRCAHASRTCSRYQVSLIPALPPPALSLKSCDIPRLSPLSDGYFNEDTKYNLCYCESCHKLRGDEAYYKRGEPPRDYALPFGWCRFALRWEDDLTVTCMIEQWAIERISVRLWVLRRYMSWTTAVYFHSVPGWKVINMVGYTFNFTTDCRR